MTGYFLFATQPFLMFHLEIQQPCDFFFFLALNCGGEAILPLNAGLGSHFLCCHLLLYQKI